MIDRPRAIGVRVVSRSGMIFVKFESEIRPVLLAPVTELWGYTHEYCIPKPERQGSKAHAVSDRLIQLN